MNDKMPDHGPVLIELDEPLPDVAAAPQIDDLEGRAMQAAVAQMARPARGGPGRWVLMAGSALLTLVLSLAAWDFVTTLLTRIPVLGWLAAALAAVLAAAVVFWVLREVLGFRGLRRLDALRHRAEAVRESGDLHEAREIVGALNGLYGVSGTDPAEFLDVEAALETAEAALLIPLDARVQAEIEGSARQVALATALVPLAFADVAAALLVNMRMIRRIAEIYGGRPGTFGNWRLARSVAVHLMATGMVAIGDDMIGSLAGGSVVSKLSRRFGEGVVNGALTARVGLGAMDLCRPLPFHIRSRPGVSAVTASALKGLFSRA